MNGARLTRDQREHLRQLVDQATRDQLDQLHGAGKLHTDHSTGSRPWRSKARPLHTTTRKGRSST